MLAQERARHQAAGSTATQPRLPHLQQFRSLGWGEQHRDRITRWVVRRRPHAVDRTVPAWSLLRTRPRRRTRSRWRGDRTRRGSGPGGGLSGRLDRTPHDPPRGRSPVGWDGTVLSPQFAVHIVLRRGDSLADRPVWVVVGVGHQAALRCVDSAAWGFHLRRPGEHGNRAAQWRAGTHVGGRDPAWNRAVPSRSPPVPSSRADRKADPDRRRVHQVRDGDCLLVTGAEPACAPDRDNYSPDTRPRPCATTSCAPKSPAAHPAADHHSSADGGPPLGSTHRHQRRDQPTVLTLDPPIAIRPAT